MTRPFRQLLAVGALVGAALYTGASTQALAVTARPASPATITVLAEATTNAARSQLTLRLPAGTNASGLASATAEMAQLTGGRVTVSEPNRSVLRVAVPASNAPARPTDVGSGSNPYPIGCSARVGSYSFTDSNGNFTVQNNCGSPHSMNWGYRISASTRSIIVGNVNEGGMGWTFAGVGRGVATGHNVPSDYFFHGTWTQVYNGGTLQYEDHIYFRHNIAGGGNGDLRLYGNLMPVA